MARPEPTDEELRTAWMHCRKASWPATFEEAMQDPVRSRLVRLTALHPPRKFRRAMPTPQSTPRARLFDPVPAARDRQSLPLPGIAPAVIDRKRAAAGDRDDD